MERDARKLVDHNDDPIIEAGDIIPAVKTKYGIVRGYRRKSSYIFKGIPYGKAARFMAPSAPECWEGIRSSMSYGPVCPSSYGPVFSDDFAFAFQRDAGYPNENCLNLNIWTQQIEPSAKMPVMIWLHGGGFSSGSSHEFPSLDGENLSEKGDVVVLSFNHRLNVLGFLDLSDYGEKFVNSANAGALDMVFALQWVKENIANFGGDPDNVTIFGQSGGGSKVMCLMNAPSAMGLFHKAIVQSGSSLCRITESYVAKKIAAETLNLLGIKSEEAESLMAIPFSILEQAAKKAMSKVEHSLSEDEMGVFGLEWEPVRDGKFLPFQPHEMAAIELSNDIPLLVGTCKNEFMPFYPKSREITMDEALLKLKEKYNDKVGLYINAVEEAYPETSKPSDYMDIDFLFRPLALKQADQKSITGRAPVFMFAFNWQSPVLNYAFKAFHCMDLPFVFNNIRRCEQMTGGGKSAYELADKMSEAWISFAKNGNPNHKCLPEWPRYSPENGATMIFDNDCEVKYHFDSQLLALNEESLK